MQRVEVMRLGGENGAVDAIGLVKPALAVQRHRLLDGAVGSHKPPWLRALPRVLQSAQYG